MSHNNRVQQETGRQHRPKYVRQAIGRGGLPPRDCRHIVAFRNEDVYARRLRVAGRAGVVAGVRDLRFPDDQAALSAGSRGRLNGYVAPGVDVVDQAIVLLPVYVLRWCRTLLNNAN